MRSLTKSTFGAVAAVALLASGCSNDLAKEGTGDVFMRIVSIASVDGLGQILSDVGTSTSTQAVVTIAARSKNPTNNTTNFTRAIQIERYEVRYYRSDGRNVEGVDVPYHFAQDIRSAIDIGDTDKNLDLGIEIVRLGAKLEPPLLNIRNGGGSVVVTIQAEVTIYGRTLASGDVIKATGSAPVEFAVLTTNQLP